MISERGCFWFLGCRARWWACLLDPSAMALKFCDSKSCSPERVLFCLLFFKKCFLEPHLWHMEVPRVWVESELRFPAYARITATQDPSHVCDLHHSSRQHWILNPLSEAQDRTRNLMVPSWIFFCCATTGTPWPTFE